MLAFFRVVINTRSFVSPRKSGQETMAAVAYANLVDTEDGTELVRTSGNLRRDGEQFFVKFSYLLQQ